MRESEPKFVDSLGYTVEIEYSYYRIQAISQHTGDWTKPFAAFNNKESGFNLTAIQLKMKEVLYLLGVIIRRKTQLGYDASDDRKLLYQLKKMPKLNQDMNSITVTFPKSIEPTDVQYAIMVGMKQNANSLCNVTHKGSTEDEHIYFITADTAVDFYKIGMIASILIKSKEGKVSS